MDTYIPYTVRVRKEVDAISKEIKQAVLDSMHSGKKVGVVAEELKISSDAVVQIILDNVEGAKYLRTEAK